MPIDTNRAVRKWSPIMDALGIEGQDDRNKMSVYSELFQQNTGYTDPEKNLLPLNLKALSKLIKAGVDYSFVDSPIGLDYTVINTNMNREQIENLRRDSFDTVCMMENILVDELVNMFKNKTIIIYQLISNMSVITESTFSPRLSLTSIVKVIGDFNGEREILDGELLEEEDL